MLTINHFVAKALSRVYEFCGILIHVVSCRRIKWMT